MDSSHEIEQSFLSLRRALKIFSALLPLAAMGQTLSALEAVARSESLWKDMLSGTHHKVPWVLDAANVLRANALLVLPVVLGIYIVSVIVTLRSKGGAFLYVNGGLYLGASFLNAILVRASLEPMRTVIEALSGAAP